MRFLKYFSLILTTFLTITSCSDAGYKFKLNTSKKVTLGEKATINFEQIKGEQIDSVKLYVNGILLPKEDKTITVNSSDFGVGKHAVTALVFYPGKVKKVNNSIEVVANKTPDVYNYNIVNTYPHDTKAYTQGLEYHDGFLYETTGRKGESWLRKIEISSGKIVQQYDLDEKYFGEGMTIFNDQIYWLTWQAGKGFIYNLSDFSKKGEFLYNKSVQGWGLTHSDTELIKSDGTNKIWFLSTDNQKELRSIQAYTNKYPVDNLNELEYINGKIYANKWQQNSIVIIDPQTGVVEGVANLNGLRDIVAKEQKLEPADDVLNGIAYDAKNNRLFVTGKHWGKLFEIELIKQ
ncbi:glutaminyl-peptide cyclotransferase [Tenacibaculum sp. IB213877]|uniref:glutaminyl-peptide cyclotransferase n=1 Tax=Tenacibaculum sp. IB213877 TaxID=3097351 RepID=UPI002A5AC112|nr:glutaminyl-peptide cyclotransferase [Tenacibaculum sp. IB213877]MDY0781100.1 glutaminyl-peptide cyclotransferase [Tenacibaculum sp. IB213877]